MLPECIGLVGGTPGKILVELKLFAQPFAGPDILCLLPLLLPDRVGSGNHLLCLLDGHEQYAICIGKYNLTAGHGQVAKPDGVQRLRITRIEPLRTGGRTAITENSETDLLKLQRVAVTAPHADAPSPLACASSAVRSPMQPSSILP